MGISDRHHFAWLVDALSEFEEKTGRFRAMMEVALVNDGPVTLVADF